MLLKRGFDASRANSSGQTALHVAAASGSVETVQLLLKFASESVDARDAAGATALHLAAAAGHEEVVALLLDSGVSLAA